MNDNNDSMFARRWDRSIEGEKGITSDIFDDNPFYRSFPFFLSFFPTLPLQTRVLRRASSSIKEKLSADTEADRETDRQRVSPSMKGGSDILEDH